MDIFVGGASASTKRMNTSALIVRGGELIGLTLTIGEGLGSDSTFEVAGSRATAISALEFVDLHAHADPSGKPAVTTMSFTLDDHGVTPIAIESRWNGLRIDRDSESHCVLHIGLSAVPPREDVTLIASHVATEGTFDQLLEGSDITAEFNHHVYRWQLTYKGGASGHDVVLRNRSVYSPDDLVTHVLKPGAAPTPSWWGHPVYPLTVRPGGTAFPGAEGYGASAKGGADGRKIYVDNLNDSGVGSLRAAVEAQGPRTIVFRTGGTIVLKSDLVIEHPYLTFDGSSAPPPGITLQRHGLVVRTHDIILRHFRIRIGDRDVHLDDPRIRYEAVDGEYALQFIDGAHNDIADHLSLSWSTNKILSTTKLSDRITVQWCILSESLNDWGEKSSYGEFDRLNLVDDYFKPGPSTVQRPKLFHDGVEAVAPASLFLSGNVLEGDEKVTADNWRGTGFYFDQKRVAAPRPFPAPPVATESAVDSLHKVLAQAGATLPKRDAVDDRIVREVTDGSGHIIESVNDVGQQ